MPHRRQTERGLLAEGESGDYRAWLPLKAEGFFL